MPDANGNALTAVFFDGQNAYMGARRVFFNQQYTPPARPPAICGQFHPMPLAQMLVGRKPDRVLSAVHVYRGRPDRHIDPKGHSANVKQSTTWAKSGVRVHPRPLRYINGNPEEKGVDVELAVALTSLSLRGLIDVAIVFTADTDVIPAIDEVRDHSNVVVEVAGWHNGKWGERVNSKPPIWCHWVDAMDYAKVEDTTDYNL